MVFLLQSFAIRFSGRLLQQSGISQLLWMSSAKNQNGGLVDRKHSNWKGSDTSWLDRSWQRGAVQRIICPYPFLVLFKRLGMQTWLQSSAHSKCIATTTLILLGILCGVSFTPVIAAITSALWCPDSNLTLLLFKISTRGQFSAVLTVVVHCAISEAKHSVLLVTRVLLMLNKVLSVELQSVTIKMILKAVHLFRVLIVGAPLKRTKHKARG